MWQAGGLDAAEVSFVLQQAEWRHPRSEDHPPMAIPCKLEKPSSPRLKRSVVRVEQLPLTMISDQVGGASININIEEPPLIHFGRVPPGAVFEHRTKTYMHRDRDLVNFQML